MRAVWFRLSGSRVYSSSELGGSTVFRACGIGMQFNIRGRRRTSLQAPSKNKEGLGL